MFYKQVVIAAADHILICGIELPECHFRSLNHCYPSAGVRCLLMMVALTISTEAVTTRRIGDALLNLAVEGFLKRIVKSLGLIPMMMNVNHAAKLASSTCKLASLSQASKT